MRPAHLALSTAAVVLVVPLGAGPAAAAAGPPGIPTVVTASAQLAGLTVAPESNASSYDRDLFPHWAAVAGTCNVRETVLQRDGQDVITNASCTATSGTWRSPYDGAVWHQASDIDIDHMVPLAEAWRSGASRWTPAKRRQFANSLADSQLWAVTDDVNQHKGDRDPSAWKPPLTSFWCTYALSWVSVKHNWQLTLQPSEKTALQEMLTTC
ncbi:DUF1524 domain-containing protein [Nonomuraea sp. NPDC050310]|uniref:GmrSD restriction endonuclease domain-containing protein n=1 Tax=Nonomuraea sp. NPDC050310 TaxID=3154935 RepID=UPI0033E7B432